jgi:predicted amidohydrolase
MSKVWEVVAASDLAATVPEAAVRLAAVQMDIRRGDPQHNLLRMQSSFRQASKAGATWVAFPECAVTGYCFDSAEEALAAAIDGQPQSWASLQDRCTELGLYCAFGFLCRDGGRLRNSAVLLGPEGEVGRFHKAHLPHLGADRFVAASFPPTGLRRPSSRPTGHRARRCFPGTSSHEKNRAPGRLLLD